MCVDRATDDSARYGHISVCFFKLTDKTITRNFTMLLKLCRFFSVSVYPSEKGKYADAGKSPSTWIIALRPIRLYIQKRFFLLMPDALFQRTRIFEKSNLACPHRDAYSQTPNLNIDKSSEGARMREVQWISLTLSKKSLPRSYIRSLLPAYVSCSSSSSWLKDIFTRNSLGVAEGPGRRVDPCFGELL